MFHEKGFFLYFFILPTINTVDMDYYFQKSLRTPTQNCNKFSHFYCQLKCGQETGVCMKEKCFCVLVKASDIKTDLLSRQSQNENQSHYSDFDDNEDAQLTEQVNEEIQPLHLQMARRHHIAHFCPNLNVARECIKKCMEEGKPAFCGKDHVCYCGHHYSNNDKNDPANAKLIYQQFKDMYQKYFGPDAIINNND